MRWHGTLGRPVAMTLTAAFGVSLWCTGPLAGAAHASGASGDGLDSVVEDFSYPDRDKVLAEKGLKLLSGDGHITVADCKSGGDLIRINSRVTKDVNTCFAVSGPVGYLSMEVEQTYLAKSEARDDVTATVRSAGPKTKGEKVEKVDLEPGKWQELGEGSDPKNSSTLLELSVGQGKAVKAPSGDPDRPWLARVTVNQPGLKGGRGCSASLVDKSWVLTAASCFTDEPATSAPAEGAPKGNATVTFAGQAPTKIDYIAPRPDRDVVLARLAIPVTKITPATLAGGASADGASLVAAGYGRTDTAWVPNSPHHSKTTQAKSTDTTVGLTGGQVCKGDAGGPVLDGDGSITAVQSRSDHGTCLGKPGKGKSASAARVDNITNWLDGASSTSKERFTLDEAAGARQVSGHAAEEASAGLGGGAELGAVGKSGGALHLNGSTAYAATAGPVVDTTKSFTVSAWVKLDNKERNYTFLSQAGDHASGFQLYYSKYFDKWVFNRHATDTDDTKIVRAMSKETAEAGVWAHLAGVYNGETRKVELFVNGKSQAAAAFTTPWRAQGGFQIGRLFYKGAWQENAAATIDDVRVVQSAATSTDTTALHKGHLPAHLQELASFPLDEAAGAQRVSGGVPGELAAKLGGGAELGVAGKSGGALRLNGATAYGATAGPVVDTTKSFTVSAWVKLDNKERNYTFLSQAGDHASGFQLYYSKYFDKWVFNRHATDTDDTKIVRAMSKETAEAGVWTHLAGVYNGETKKVELFVNGKSQATAAFTTPWRAQGGFQIGRLFYKGAWQENAAATIDDVRVVQSAATSTDTTALQNGDIPSHLQELGTFSLDEKTGSARVSGGNAAGSVATMAGSGAKLGVSGKLGSALHLDGSTAYAATAGPVVDTTKSFTVSAWVKLDNKERNYTFLSQAGDHASGFQLYYSKYFDKWVFNRHATDTDGTKIVRAMSKETAEAGVWTHLAGVYNGETKKVELFVNGKSQATAAFTTPWRAQGGFQIGRLFYKSAWQENAAAAIDNVRVWDRAVGANDIVNDGIRVKN
ncbi:LamG-like jellyroll fold domain-containing protein [Streptomyces halobius]|uniref:Trypsin-like serine protease n=1 Tax=Streptomyces halobius TaxID=2879846 RepID=A0ABY4M1L1_9ACTN|nr:LamG-like jellyroll fold domain-containing protein [Streptomyces halobius]UQA91583.1 trypsin-like serine protease [Streptomyces halobius]